MNEKLTVDYKTGQKTRFPNCKPNQPMIFADDNKNKYPCFCIRDIYRSLFAKGKDKQTGKIIYPLILLSSSSHKMLNSKPLLHFLLPPSIFDAITEHKTNGKETFHADDYRDFFLRSTKNNKITNYLFQLFSSEEENSEKIFVESIQRYYINLLKHASFQESKLMTLLTDLVDNVIAPTKISKEANASFHDLMDSKEHDNIAIVIANIFISAMLGLYSMKYINESKVEFRRTYVLNELGMKYIWLPDTINDSYLKLQGVLSPYVRGSYQTACINASLWLDQYSTNVSQKEAAPVYGVLGISLYCHPKDCSLYALDKDTIKKLKSLKAFPNYFTKIIGVEEKENSYEQIKKDVGIQLLIKSVSYDDTLSKSAYLLYKYYIEQDKTDEACKYLDKAFRNTYVEAVTAAVEHRVKANDLLKEVADKEMIEKLTSIISNQQNYTDTDVSKCLYLRGQLYAKTDNDRQKADRDFEEAARMGHDKARQQISRQKRMQRQTFPTFTNDPHASCCYVNTMDGNNLEFVSTLPDGKWSLFSSEKQNSSDINAVNVKNLDEFIQIQHLSDFNIQRPKLVFLFMSTDKDRNLNECLILLDKLFNIALTSPVPQRNALMDRIEIYVEARYEVAATLLDANINDMGNDIYFKVHIVDEARDSAHQLLCDAPLFLPFLNKTKQESAANIVLFGCSPANYQLLKESIGCAYLGEKYPVNITLLGSDADSMERRLRQECPGLFHKPYIACIRPKFISCCIEEEDFPSLIYGSKYENDPDNELVKALSLGNYFVIDLSNDYDSIRFAMELRTWLLRSQGTFKRTPFIGVKCNNSQNSYLTTHLTLSGQSAGNTYYSKYDLFPFGVSKEMYSYHRLIENPRLEEVALQIHKSYYGTNDRQAENDYYSFSYNADSSLSTAIGLSYRLFAGGAFYKQKERYLNYGVFDPLALLPIYVEAIKTKEDDAAALEQSRWNGFMLSRGWESADTSQVSAYKDQSTGSSHKHTLAKLHPFIREWADLSADKLTKILGMLESKFNYKKSPQETTRKSIKDMPKFLDKPSGDHTKFR